MIERAYVHVVDPNRPDVEAQAVLEILPARGIDVQTFTAKRMRRRQLALSPTTLVAGDLDMMAAAFKVLGVEAQRLPTYPASLAPLMGRRQWTSTVDAVLTNEGDLPVFVKPLAKDKRFTGFVFGGYDDAFRFQGASGRLEVQCSTVVEFVSEYRAYVVHGQVRGLCHYHGADDQAPPAAFLDDALNRLRRTDEAVAGFSIDVGRLANGRWVVVECNEGYGLGRYPGLAAEP
ncbi:MAG: ATP-grasp domain-containing protein [Myxococcota bacterium]